MDEYLQAARIGIEPGRVDLQLDLTPGQAVFESVIAAIDRDGNAAMSDAEKRGYVSAVFDAVALTIDGRALTLGTISSTFPEFEALRRGEGVIRLRASAPLPSLDDGAHELEFRNAHRPEVSVYLANALVPVSDRVAINAQRRDQAQVMLAIDFTLSGTPPAASAPIAGWLVAALTVFGVLIGTRHKMAVA